MPNRSAYDASSIEWPRIRAYAKRVARETRRSREQPLSYTVREYRDTPKKVETAHGPFGLFTKLVDMAERVAVDRRVEVAGAHWVLEHRHHHIERDTKIRDGKHQETTHEQHYVILLPDDTLQKAVIWEEEVLRTEYGKTTCFSTHDHSVGELSAGDVRAMDFEKRHSEHGTHGKGTKTWGDREPGTRLLGYAKGVGLTQALKRLL